MYYTIYKITNNTNNKTYIGKHETKNINDNYMGSGKLLIRAIKKYGITNFSKEILHICSTVDEMNQKEKELVTKEFVSLESNYNLCPGGNGGFGYINANKLGDKSSAGKKGRVTTDQILQERYGDNWRNVVGKQGGINCQKTYSKSTDLQNARSLNTKKALKFALTPDAIEKRKKTYKRIAFQQGINNSQYGTCWITNGIENKKIKLIRLSEYENIGYHRGNYGTDYKQTLSIIPLH